MKDSIIILWGSIIITLVLAIFAIGLYEEKNKEELNVKRTFKEAAKDYVKDHKELFEKDNNKAILTYDLLNKEGYIDEVKYNNKSCTGNIVVRKKVIFYLYEPTIKCE